MDGILSATLSFLLSFVPITMNPNSVQVSRESIGSTTIIGLTTKEAEVLRDDNFRYFIVALSEIEDNYRRAGTLDTKKMMVGALRGVLQYGTSDLYSKFIPDSEVSGYTSQDFTGEHKDKNGAVVEETTVTWKILKHGLVVYLRISKFRYITIKQFDRAIDFLASMRPRGLIIDLRGNCGGMSNSVLDMMCYLIPSTQVVARFEDYGRSSIARYPTRDFSYRAVKKIPPVSSFDFVLSLRKIVMIDGDTASAAEIMASALRDAGCAKLLGQKSFGKGTFQNCLSGLLGMSKMTGGRWLTSSGDCLQGNGLKPDYEVLDTRPADEDYDAQLYEAVKLLRSAVPISDKKN